MFKSNLKWLGALFIVLVLVLSACSEDDSSAEKESPNDNDDNNESKDLVIAMAADASSLDPAGSNDVPSHKVENLIYDTLVSRDLEGDLIPGLAETWDAIDEVTHEFKLRKDVKFHDGEDFNADVVKKNIERLLDSEVASSVYNKFDMIENVEVVDEYTVRIETSYPFTPIYGHLAHPGGSMVSPVLIDEDYKAMEGGAKAGTVISEKPIGTGLFKFESWNPGEEIKLVRNDDYWNEKAIVDTVTFKIIPESGTRNADLERGFVHIADPVQPNEVEEINGGSFGEVKQTSSNGMAFIGFNTEKAPFDDVRVREAVSMMINKDEIIEGVYEGFGIAAYNPLAPKIFGFSDDVKGPQYDVEGAKKLLEEAGYADGFEAEIWTNDDQQRIDAAIILQNALKEVNIDLKIEQMEFGSYLEKLRSGDHDMYILGWNPSLPDADNGLYQLFHSSDKGNTPNVMFYGDDEVDRLLDEARREADQDKRYDLYVEAQKKIVEDAPMIYLIYQENLTGVSNKITGLEISSTGMFLVEKVDFVDE